MQKLILDFDNLDLQSFETAPDAGAERGTVLGRLDDAGRDACSDTCASLVYTCAACETYDASCTDDDGPDAGRRIIVYQGS
jgi:hypothetical protein